jgi:hypothetical protein
MPGTRQGDTTAAQNFSSAFQRVTQAFDHTMYNAFEDQYMVARHPWYRRYIFLESSLWADDYIFLERPRW